MIGNGFLIALESFICDPLQCRDRSIYGSNLAFSLSTHGSGAEIAAVCCLRGVTFQLFICEIGYSRGDWSGRTLRLKRCADHSSARQETYASGLRTRTPLSHSARFQERWVSTFSTADKVQSSRMRKADLSPDEQSTCDRGDERNNAIHLKVQCTTSTVAYKSPA